MNTQIQTRSILVAFFLASFIAQASINIPTPPSSIKEPEPISLSCISTATRLPALEACRQLLQLQRDALEDYNSIIKRYCDRLVNYDAKLRNDAFNKKLSWNDYESAKEELTQKLEACSPETGELYAPYRSRMREYRAAISLHNSKRDAILNGPVSIGGQS